MNGKSRYPGIRAFEESEQFLFFGRNEEIRRLHVQVKANTLVVLFAKSGIGKSSLLNAGLVPLLDYDRYRSVKVRFQDTSLSPTDTLKKALEPYLDTEILRVHTNQSPAETPLWEYLRACRFERYDEPATPVLIFDQFEEFFEHAPEERRRFMAEMADLANNRLPLRIYESIARIQAEQRSAADLAWHTPIPVKVVFAIRSDRISLLHDLSADIPAILQNRFELRPLGRAAARAAIVQPAAIIGKDLVTSPFTYDPAALELMLGALENKNGEVESFQLQLVCQHVEKQISKGLAGGGTPITDDVFGGEEGIKNILRNYYEDTLAEFSPGEQALARDFIERGLIVSGRRVGVTEGVEQESWHIGQPLLKKLLDTRLIRAETTHLGKSYEVSHDALVEPIVRSRKAREAELAQQRLEEENRRLEEENRQREIEAGEQRKRAEAERLLKEQAVSNARRARIFSVVSLLLLVVVLTFGYFSLLNSRDNLIEQANEKLQNQRYRESRDLFEQVLDNGLYDITFYNKKELETRRDSAYTLERLQNTVLHGDTLYFKEDYYQALREYESARNGGYPGLEGEDGKIRRTDKVRRLLLEVYRRKAVVFDEADPGNDEEAHRWACFYYCKATSLDPDAGDLRKKVLTLKCKCE